MARMVHLFLFFAAVCCAYGMKSKTGPTSEESYMSSVRDESKGFAKLLLALGPGSTNVGKLQSRLSAALEPVRSKASDVAMQELKIPKPVVVNVDTLTRRGFDYEEEIDNEYFSRAENDKMVADLRKTIEKVNALEDQIEELEDEELAAKTDEFRKRLANGETEDDIMVEAFAVVREAAWRTLELRHYDVQLIGGLGLHKGMMVQMGTGEGKTLVSTSAVYLNALRGTKGNMLITVNDYLARRDAEQMGQVHKFLGLTVGLVQKGMKQDLRKEAYKCDVTYVTNSEFGFDYLRDHSATMSADQKVLPPLLNFCVVDEGDSVLIDEARTPLLISDKADDLVPAKYVTVQKLAAAMTKDVHYEVKLKEEQVSLFPEGLSFACEALQVPEIFTAGYGNLVTTALKAKEFKVKDKDYIVSKNGTIELVDLFSGRVLEGRKFGGGLHQAIEAQEGVEITSETKPVARITYPALFGLFKKLSAMSGTVVTEAKELAEFYKLKVLDVPPALPKERLDIPLGVYRTIKGKSFAALEEMIKMHESGRPVLVGTTTIDDSEIFAAKLRQLKIKHSVLNAKEDLAEREAEIVAQAGRKGAITISTNMAGRGTDIILGGAPKFMAQLRLRDAIAAAAGIEVPAIEEDFYPCNLSAPTLEMIDKAVVKYVAVEEKKEDNELRKLELDEFLAVAASSAAVYEDSAEDLARNAYEEIKDRFVEILAPEKDEVLALGGLHVIGTNLHDSRRIDDQLKGRAGRQGDPGSSHFFISLADPVFKIFNGDRVGKFLELLRAPEDIALESQDVIKIVKQTQAKVEDYYLDIRKTSAKVDEVVNDQREVWYKLRDECLLRDESQTMAWMKQKSVEVVDIIIKKICARTNSELGQAAAANEIYSKMKQVMPGADLEESQCIGSQNEVKEALHQAAVQAVDKQFELLNGFKGELALQTARYLAILQVDTMWTNHLQALRETQGRATFEYDNEQRELTEQPTEEGLQAAYARLANAEFKKLQEDWIVNTIFSWHTYDPAAQAAQAR